MPFRVVTHWILALCLIGTATTTLGHDDRSASLAVAASERLTGTIQEIVIDDRLSHSVTSYRELRQDDGTTIPLRGTASDGLQAHSRVELTGHRAGKGLDVESARMLAAPKAAEPATMQIEGTLAVAHGDDFPAGRSQYVYEIHDAGGNVTRLDIATLPPPLQWGMRVSVSGRPGSFPASVRPSTIAIVAPAPEEPAKSTRVPTKTANTVLVIMANFSNTTTPSFTQAQAEAVMTSNTTSVANFYNEASFGSQTMTVTVTTWVTMSLAQPSTCNNSDWQGIGNAATSAAAAANGAWNSANYGFVVYLFPAVPACGWNGLAYIGSPHKAYINGTNSFITKVIAHEMGHNFGLLHAASLDCGSVPIGGSCAASEYGDPFDTMGNQNAMHFNAIQKRKLNWIGSTTVATHSAGNATYMLSPIESGGGALYAVKIPAATNRTYWIEFRQPIGFDNAFAYPNNGAQIRVASPFETLCSGCDSFSDDTELLDMTPGTSAFSDAALLVGQSFTDSTYGITVNVLAASASALSVQVSMGGGQAASTTALASSANPSTAGSNVTFTATVTGSSPTGSVAFRDASTTIANCGAIPLSGTTASCTTNALTVGTHSVTATYSGDAANTGSTSSALVQTVNAYSTTTGIATSANPAQSGSTITFTATVSGNAPTGTVVFTDGGIAIAGCASATLVGNGNIKTATCATSSLASGTHSVAAAYPGDAINAGSTSAPLSQVVQNATGGQINFALAINGGVASASSTYGGSFPVAAVNDGDRTGYSWGSGGGWNDASSNAFPDWLQVAFNGVKTIDRVVVYTLGDNYYAAPVVPSDTQTFALWGLVDFTVQAWNGTAWTTVASVSGNNLVKRTVTFPGVATDRVRVNVNSALGGYSRIVELEAWGSETSSGSVNVALAANGGVASASSVYSGAFPVGAINDGDRRGVAWGNGGGWNDATINGFPDWAQINFANAKTIDRIVLYTLSDSYYVPSVLPSDTETFGQFGVVDFNVQIWNGAAWTTVASVTGNNLVKRVVTFSPVSTDRVRVNVTSALGGYARIVELEAWSASGGASNVALASAGGVATASTTIGPAFPVAAINNGDRVGSTWGSGGGWNDGTSNAFPDWAQIDFNGPRTIDRVVVYTLSDNYYATAAEPTDAQTFGLSGIVDFDVLTWNGSGWITVATVNGNNLVKRTVTFSAVTTDRIRVNVRNALAGYSRIVELEAWGQ